MQVLGGLLPVPQSLFVGGCVRNLLLDKPVSDIDIATTLTPLEVIQKLTDAGIRYIPTGLDHGTVTALVEDAKFEITTLRKDISTDGRHAVIAFSHSWQEDAHRRDFTINTLLASCEGMIFDPLGCGLEHLDQRKVIFVGDPDQRISEDYLRILRFFRFYGQYGEGAPDEAALEACGRHAENLAKLSRERITQEFLKILALATMPDTLSLMQSHGVLDITADKPETYKGAAERLVDLQQRFEVPNDMARLLLISGLRPDFLEEWLVLSNAQKKELTDLADCVAQCTRFSLKKIREMVYRFGNAITLQTYLLRLASRDELPELDVLDIARYWHAPVFPVTGDDLKAKGFSQGPAMGKKLKELEEKWISSDFKVEPVVKAEK